MDRCSIALTSKKRQGRAKAMGQRAVANLFNKRYASIASVVESITGSLEVVRDPDYSTDWK